jgi:predicted kinase
MLIALAGLPATGKSALADRLAAALGGVVLNKDRVRAALFPPPALDYSAEQDDLCMTAIYRTAAYVLRTSPHLAVIIDGRTFSRAAQLHDLLALAESVGETLYLIECTCSEEVARERLERAAAVGEHPAGNRTFELYQAVKGAAEPLTLPRLVLDTGRTALEECVERCLAFIRSGEPAAHPPLPPANASNSALSRAPTSGRDMLT